MSLLRLSRPGLPTRLVILDDGATPVRKPSYTGTMIAAAVPHKRPPEPQAAEPYQRRTAETCGLLMRNTRALCGRKPRHADACRTAKWMQGQAMGRRTT